jgi:hypothetical protein
MRLVEKQQLFAKLVGDLLTKAYDMGYQVTLGDAFRDPRLHGFMGQKQGYGHASSTHKARLAIDLNLFKDGEFLTGTEDHRPLGEWWKKQHQLCRWGGDFRDGNHYSLEHEGVK